MHPSFSVIFFTTASGAGYGLLALAGLLAPWGAVPQDWRFGLAALSLAFVGITAGLLSSTFHLGHPERAWRAFSQWRSSWLSREGVAAIASYLPAGLFAAGWIFFETISASLGALAAACAALTVYCTAMIYRSLKPVPRWYNRWVVPNYFSLALMNGSLWLAFLAQCFGPYPELAGLALCTTALAAICKLAYWRSVDTQQARTTSGSATGLGSLGTVRLFEAPHTSENYLMKEMGYQIARKHAAKLRRIAVTLAFCLPALLSLLAAIVSAGWMTSLLMLLAASAAMAGVFVERWLFFAEARHVVTTYYGATTV